MLAGWNAFGRKDWQLAETLFSTAYRKQPDKESAEGWLLALGQQGCWAQMEALAAETEPQLAEAARKELSARLRSRKLFVAAARPTIDNQFSLFAGGGFAWKSGTAGEDRLFSQRIPLAAIEWQIGRAHV